MQSNKGGSKTVLGHTTVTDLRMETCLRYGTLVLVVLQTTATVLLMRYSRTREGTPYLPSTAVFLAEILKVLVCYIILLGQNGKVFAQNHLFEGSIQILQKNTYHLQIIQ